MKKIISGAIAGILATIVLSIIMIVKSKAGVLPELNIIAMIEGLLGGGVILGWIAHFAIGIGYGVTLAIIHDKLPTNSLPLKGIMLGVAGWFGMMVTMMPMAGAGMFALGISPMAPVMTLVMHIIFGATLGIAYKKLS